jgi:UDP-2,4-diacetamido-2,4,6-trideoxy-beta-L-altropyranose hydrolase
LSGNILFRVDVSNLIGSGHLMRCLTLANEARLRGWQSSFAMRDPSSNIIDKVKSSGHEIHLLVDTDKDTIFQVNDLTHSDWLVVSQVTDSIETSNLIEKINPDWVVVDHYAIDVVWHQIIRKTGRKLLVIDDLADRVLDCDILVNQNVGFSAKDYDGKITTQTEIFLGPTYAVLRPEFQDWREFSLRRRKTPILNRVLITMGGADAQNHTLKVFQELEKSINSVKVEFFVVLGALYPFLDEFNEFMETSTNKITKLTNIENMAEIMANSDICIGAAGSSSWERCCLGVPTLMLTIADNQKRIASSLNARRVAVSADKKNLASKFDTLFETGGSNELIHLTKNSSELCDGFGASRILESLE